MRTALTIAGSDSSGGAGIQADLKTFAAFGLYGASAITAITAQSTKGIEATLALPADLVTAQIEAVAGDLAIHATKIGMLANAAIVEAVAAAIAELDLPLVVARSGAGVVERRAPAGRGRRPRALRRAAAARSRRDAEHPGGRGAQRTAHPLDGRCARRGAADPRDGRRPRSSSPAATASGRGHRSWRADGRATIVDLLFDGHVFHEFRAPRVDSRHTHGTGCTYASAVAAGLALGRTLPDAAARRPAVRRRRDSRMPPASATAADRSIISGSDGPANIRNDGPAKAGHYREHGDAVASVVSGFSRTLAGPRILKRCCRSWPSDRDRSSSSASPRRSAQAAEAGARRRGRDVPRSGAQPQPRAERPIS